VAVVIGATARQLTPLYGSVVPAQVVRNPLGVEEEQAVTIFVCRRPVRTLQEIWPGFAGRN